MIMVHEMMNWEEALKYWRMHYIDLVSVTTETDRCVTNKSLKHEKCRNRATCHGSQQNPQYCDGLWF